MVLYRIDPRSLIQSGSFYLEIFHNFKESLLSTTVSFQRPSLLQLFGIYLSIGIQSFGGGSSTFIMIHQVCIQRGWYTEEQFVRNWALAQIAPGINLLKLSIQIGHKLRGWPGVISSMAGLMLPSALVTVLMTAGFSAIRDQPVVKAAMKGILPATIGLSLAMAYQMAQPLLVRGYKEGWYRLAAHIVIMATSALLLGIASVSPVVVLLVAGVLTLGLLWVVPARPRQAAEKSA